MALPRRIPEIQTIVGVDPGTTAGIAFYDLPSRKFTKVTSGKILEMMDVVFDADDPLVLIEDARLAKYWRGGDAARAQGAGSVKRDCAIWEEFCVKEGFDYQLIRPNKKATKMDAATFRALTGHSERTNSHSRDAAMLILHSLKLLKF